MKVAIFTDFHVGVRRFSTYFIERQKEFVDIFFDDCEKNNIENILFLGDFFDNRKYIDLMVLYEIVDYFIDKLENSNIKNMISIVGNHDMYYGNSFDKNSILYLSNKSKKIKVIDSIVEKNISGKKCLFVPFIHKNNFEDFSEKIQSNKYDYCFGHFNISDFYGHLKNLSEKKLNKIKNSDSLRITTFKDIKKVFSGHIHLRAENKNVVYIGSPIQYSFEQAGIEQGYYFLDFKTDEYEFIPYKNQLFFKFDISSIDDFREFEQNRDKYYGKYIHITFSKTISEKEKEKIMDRIRLISEKFEYIDFFDENIADDIATELDMIDDDEYLKKIESFLLDNNVSNILDDYINVYHKEMPDEDKVNVKERFIDIYNECNTERKN